MFYELLFAIPYFLLVFPIMAGLLWYNRKHSNTPSKWKFPPTQRIFQFSFMATFLIYLCTLGVFMWGTILMVSVASPYRMMSWVAYTLYFPVTALAVWRPRFTILFLILFGAKAYIDFIENPKNRTNTSTYVDICNELRKDPNCVESDEGFKCGPQGIHKNFQSNKTICENNTGENEEDTFTSKPDPRVGKTFKTTQPILVIKNLPRTNCFNRRCGHIVENTLAELRNPCSNCISEDRLTTKLRMSYIPVGTNYKVLSLFETEEKSLRGSKLDFILVQDDKGLKSEFMEIYFNDFFEAGLANDNSHKIVEGVEKIIQNGTASEIYCEHPEKIKRFTKLFEIPSEIEIEKFSQSVPGYPNKCSLITYKTENAYLLHKYYQDEFK